MKRRGFIAAGAATLAMPHVARSQPARLLRFIPQVDVPVLDPVATSAYITRNHGLVIFDTLFGQDGHYQPQPQMVDGFTTDPDGRLWRLTLREGLRFHDGTAALARSPPISRPRRSSRCHTCRSANT